MNSNEVARKRALADPAALMEYAFGRGWPWFEAQLQPWMWVPLKGSASSVETKHVVVAMQTPAWHALELHDLVFSKHMLQKVTGRPPLHPNALQRFVNHLDALPEAPDNNSDRSLLTSLVQSMIQVELAELLSNPGPADDKRALPPVETQPDIDFSTPTPSDAEQPDIFGPPASALEPVETQPDHAQSDPGDDAQPDDELATAESVVERARLLYTLLYREAKRMTEYKRMLATRERCAAFEAKLNREAAMLNHRFAVPLPDRIVTTVAGRVAGTIARFQHHPMLQRERQRKQVVARGRKNRGRDQLIVRLHESGDSNRAIATQVGMSKDGVRKVLLRKLPKPPAQTRKSDTSATS